MRQQRVRRKKTFGLFAFLGDLRIVSRTPFLPSKNIPIVCRTHRMVINGFQNHTVGGYVILIRYCNHSYRFLSFLKPHSGFLHRFCLFAGLESPNAFISFRRRTATLRRNYWVSCLSLFRFFMSARTLSRRHKTLFYLCKFCR